MKLPLLNELDIETHRAKMAAAPAFPHFCFDNFLEESFANEVYESFPSFGEAQKLGFEFNAVNEKRKIQITDSSKFPPAIYKLHQIMASPEFVDAMSRMSGIKNLIADPALAGGGIHETNSGGHLDVHVDFNFNEVTQLHRRLNILVYFNKDWKEEYGGILDLWDKDVKNCVGRFAPVFNRAAGFATSELSWHGVTPITCPPGNMRKSFAVYYYTKEAPEGWTGVGHSTVFKARPTEYWKGNVAMPAENAARAARNTIHNAKQKLKNLMGV
jgi:Rps23 Pro-64 3,4-dihydroxylase Tpa1-like proline 4-hydroxylase